MVIAVVLDTNVLIAAFRSSRGASYRLLQTLERQKWRPVISPALALEYETVLKRYARDLGLRMEDIDDFTEYLCSRAQLVQIYFRWRPVLPDPDDDRILEVSVRTGSPIVTFNARDFRGSESFGIQILSPGELLTMIGDR
ncbi:MAG TPA: PIN domain-containing protein [Bryobacteraceae bacterium]|nr:PIN domain-containing protein [Bryobacteraceae bacterium]